MTDAEADAGVWAELAENLEGAGYGGGGLCICLSYLTAGGLIDREQRLRMKAQLFRYRSLLTGNRKDAYFWRRNAVAPRIAACRKLARITA